MVFIRKLQHSHFKILIGQSYQKALLQATRAVDTKHLKNYQNPSKIVSSLVMLHDSQYLYNSLQKQLLRFKKEGNGKIKQIQIRFILLQNRQGKTRLSKWFMHYEETQKVKLQSEIHRMIVMRDSKQTNFIEFHNFKIIYKRYAGLYFALCIDVNDNQLLHLELIHLLVETLDQYFGNVCELDIVFNFNKVYGILDEMIVGGQVLETSKASIVSSLKLLQVED